jgi:protein gp37
MSTSKIEWTESTWNPVTGCSKISGGCANCYAERMVYRLKAMGQKNYKIQKVPFFFKQWGGTNKKKAGRLIDGKIISEMPQKYDKSSNFISQAYINA